MGSMSEHPDRDRVAGDERRIGALLHAVEAPAPEALHERIAALTAERRPRRLLSARRGRTPRTPSLAFAGAFAAAVTVAIVLVVSTGGSPPSALSASRLALEHPTAHAPATLLATGTTIAFPHWSARGWPSVGVRHDTLGGRAVTTEFYRSYEGGTLGYAIVSGAPLAGGGGGRVVARAGADYRMMSSAGAQIVTWVQDGHTCVLASRSAPASTLLRLAAAQEHAATA